MLENNKLNVTLSVDVETYLPSFEHTSKLKSSNVIERFEVNRKGPNGYKLTKTGWADQNSANT